MANASIGGLVSGLDTATIISQLMQLEARPQVNLRNRVTTEQRAITALQTLNSKLASIATQAGALAKATAWGAMAATSSNELVTVTADPGAAPGQLSFTVDAVATAARASYSTTASGGSVVMDPGVDYTITFDDGRPAQTFSTGDGTLTGIAADINNTSGVRATLVRVGVAADGSTPTYRLQVTSTATGASSGFTIGESDPADPASPTPFLGGVSTTTAGTDATITLEGQTTPLTSRSNTITDLMPGVDVTLASGATGITTLKITLDPKSASDKVRSLVDAVNAALTEVRTLTAANPATKTKGLLAGDAGLRTVADRLVSTFTAAVGGQSPAAYGIQSDRTGNLIFDPATFQAAYAADPARTAATFTAPADPAAPGASTGLAAAVEKLATTFSSSTDGVVTLAIQGRTSTVTRLQGDIDGWDVRLATKRQALERQYGALEVALGKLQSQSSWLAGQIGSLPTMNRK